MSYLLQQKNGNGLVIDSIPFATETFAKAALLALEILLLVAGLDKAYTYNIVEATAQEERKVG